MKKLFFAFTTILFLLKYHKCFKAISSTLFCLKLNIDQNNILQCNHALLTKSKIQIRGVGNKILICGNISRADILIVGTNNQIILEDRTNLFNSRIVLRGNNCKIQIGENSTFGNGLYMVCMGNKNEITIGENCMFADNIDLWNTDSHAIKNSDGQIINSSKPVNIGKNVWIGKNSTILKGTHVGDGVVVGMNSTITKNLPPYTLCIGNPARPIKNDIFWERDFISE
jgi:acetyltransferase-like isoleucine patch superfamily enzyme